MNRRAWLTRFAALFLLLPGCAGNEKPAGTPIEQAWERPAPAPPPAQPPSPVVAAPASRPSASTGVPETEPAPVPSSEILAVVNGTPISRQAMSETLMRTHGLSLLEQMILLTALKQRAAQMGVAVTAADVKNAHEDALRRLATPVGGIEEEAMDRQAAERLLAEFLLAKNISRSEWDRRMEQQAYLRKIATAEVEKMSVTDQMLRDEYALAYDERVQIRHIQVSSLQAAARVRDALAAKREFVPGTQPGRATTRPYRDTASSKNFELVARQFSENQLTAARGGLMPPFTKNEPTVTPLIRETAFSMEVGQVSPPISEGGNMYHILLLERRFPASDVGFENVERSALAQRFRERRIRQRQETLEPEVFRSAAVDVRDPELAQQFRARFRQGTK